MLTIVAHLVVWLVIFRLLPLRKRWLSIYPIMAICTAVLVPSLAWDVVILTTIPRSILIIGTLAPFILIAVLIVRRWVALPNRKAVAGVFVLGVAACMVFSLMTRIVFPTAREALSTFTLGIEEQWSVNGFLPDFYHQLEARVNEADFHQFAKRMGFSKRDKRTPTLYQEGEATDRYHRKVEYKNGKVHYDAGRT